MSYGRARHDGCFTIQCQPIMPHCGFSFDAPRDGRASARTPMMSKAGRFLDAVASRGHADTPPRDATR